MKKRGDGGTGRRVGEEKRLGNVGNERRWSKRRMKVRRGGDRVC
jgi:hypothetical protein